MNIIEAVKIAERDDKCITRKKHENHLKYKPTPYHVLGIVVIYNEKIGEKERVKTTRFWNPKSEDILADDWIVID